jgi:sugar phosphate isomerase/epimerase
MKAAVTICLVPEARGGPFVFHCDAGVERGLAEGCAAAAAHGFDGVEIFPESAAVFPTTQLGRLLDEHGLTVAAVGTGAGWVKRKLHLCLPDHDDRTRAIDFIAGLVDVAGALGAPAIIGSMQGRHEGEVSRGQALDRLADALALLGERAARHGQVILYEPLNRYETNLFNRQEEAAAFLAERGLSHVRLLADLFHMNIEEADMAAAIRAAGGAIGHVHFADSNRRAMGLGHTDPGPVLAALAEIGYDGWLSAEVFPLPSADEAARKTIERFRASCGPRRSTPC